MEDAIEVSEAGLRLLAGQHDTAAVALAGVTAPAVAGSPSQASVAAVSNGNIVVDVTAATLAARITESGAKLRTAATCYASADSGAAEPIAAIARSLDI